MNEKKDPIAEINKTDLCIHCIHHDCCFVEKMLNKLLIKIPHKFGYFSRKFSEVAEVCKVYKRGE